MKSVQKGFTLIELMIVVAIIGILAAIAIPAYQDYTIRSQLTEGPNLAGALETATAEYYANTGSFPTSNSTVGITGTITGKYVASEVLGANGILITYGGTQLNSNVVATGAVLYIYPTIDSNNDVIWNCGYKASVGTFTGGITAGTTTVLPKYLPQNCRA
jgi:type IV pilus assembly protein PilA